MRDELPAPEANQRAVLFTDFSANRPCEGQLYVNVPKSSHFFRTCMREISCLNAWYDSSGIQDCDHARKPDQGPIPNGYFLQFLLLLLLLLFVVAYTGSKPPCSAGSKSPGKFV